MRGKGAIAACVGLALLAAGCDGLDRRYFREGIGTELYTTELPDATQLQELYVGFICRQAGLPVVVTAGAIPTCDYGAVGGVGWTAFVQAGMNDIDARCDAYLSWLDSRKRFSGAIMQQIHDTRTATEAILAFTLVDPRAIAVVGSAFGFAASTFTNLNTRLLLEVNHSTVQSLVLNRQTEYRQGIKTKLIANRPAAIYALRSYLRLCMPMTIETEINTTVTSVERNDAPPGRMITPEAVVGQLIPDPTAPLPKPLPRRPPIDVEPIAEDIRDFQNALCLPADGKKTAILLAAIGEYLGGREGTAPRQVSKIGKREEALLRDAVQFVVNCRNAGFLTAYEVGAYGVPAGGVSALVRINELQKQLGVPLAPRFTPEMRAAIEKFRVDKGIKPPLKGQVDHELRMRLIQ